MLPTKDEIERIIKDHIVIKYMTIDPLTGHLTDPVVCGVSAAAKAIAARLERAYLILELLAESDGDAHQVDECIKAARELLEREEVAC